VGDLHQPLHAGFGHDRGGNDFEITYNDEEMNLHRFWDSALIRDRSESWISLYDLLSEREKANPDANWDPSDVVAWTNESHEFAATHSYPDTRKISEDFADQSWVSLKKQLRKGGYRLASVLNTVLNKKSEKKHCRKSADKD
jgi:hypothetical protein